LIAIGCAGVGTAGWVYYDAWSTRQTWDASPEAAALAQQDAQPTPIWIEAPTPGATPIAAIQPLPTPSAPTPLLISIPTPVITATADDLSLDSADFRFLDPPEPGAHARLAISVANHAGISSGRILLGIDSSWFESYSIIGTAPAVASDKTDDEGLRTFSFPPVGPNVTAEYELHVTATAEGTTPPTVKVLVESGDVIGEDKPSTLAPTPRPGPVMSIAIPSLKLKSGVVQVAWEPPPYAIGQIKGTAKVSLGNTVLVGHLTGAAGNVFAHLDTLQPGDEITAVSRGLPYKFVVSQTFEGANTDESPMQPTDDARLTLMTCAGIWNPFTHDYSERLWVVAEPPDQAAVTIANAQATATATAALAEATATQQAIVDATATAEAVPTETPTPVPTPFAGEPSLPGGLGNTRVDLERTFGYATGETSGKLVVFRQPGREEHVRFTADPPRALLVATFLDSSVSFDAAVAQSRKLFPTDSHPRTSGPEGNSQFIVERFSSANLGQVLDGSSGDFTVIYTRDSKGAINGIVLGLGDDLGGILADARR
jgi:sortase (surface protein transpeptidase)